MKRRFLTLCLTLAAILLPASALHATLGTDYQFTATNGAYSALGSTASVAVPGDPNSPWGRTTAAGPFPIGFNFTFGCTSYSTFTTNAHGMIMLGTTTSASFNNTLTGAPVYPVIAPFWDDLDLWTNVCNPALSPPTGVYYQTSGVAPNRVLTVDWRTGIVSGNLVYNGSCTFGQNLMNFQLKLYETTNRIEFSYSGMYNGLTSSSTIGIALSPTDFMSVTPGTSSTMSTTSAATFDIITNSIPSGTLYRFDPTSLKYTGRTGPGNGGTVTAADGGTFFTGFSEQLGNRSTYNPFELTIPCASAPIPMSMSISGVGAADYSFGATGTQNYSTTITGGSTLLPQIQFTPTRSGVRPARLTVVNGLSGDTRVYLLAATGNPRIRYIGNIDQGGTNPVADGDSLMLGMGVLRRSSITYRPITVENFNLTANYSTAPVLVTATIDSFDLGSFESYQYKLVHPVTGALVDSYSKMLAPGDTFAPRIMFRAESAGKQHARMVVTNGDGEDRTFHLAATSYAPSGTFEIAGETILNSVQFASFQSCVGEYVNTLEVIATNTGSGPLLVNGFTAYDLDTVFQQGTPHYPALRDARMRLVPANNYGLYGSMPTAPLSSNPSGQPIVIPEGQSRTLYLTFVPDHPGKRWSRAYIRTNAQNFSSVDSTIGGTTMTEGLITLDLFGIGFGSQLAMDERGKRPHSMVLPSTRVGATVEQAIPIFNTGACDLRISHDKLRIYSGDVSEFTLLPSLQTARRDPVTGDLILAPGAVDSIRVRFRPSRAGTRMATLWIQTNDSTISRPGISERGSYYLDLHGRGLAGLDGRDLVLNPVTIGGSVEGTTSLENTLNIPVGITGLKLEGGDVAEFAPVGWPALPTTVLPGSTLQLGIRLTPVGDAGVRRTTIVITTTTGDTVRVSVRGEAGTQTLVIAPNTLFDNVSIPLGQLRRELVMITNMGTLPVRITSLKLLGPDAAAYRIGVLPRRDLEPGQTEHLEMTFAPTTPGLASAQLEVRASNGGTYLVELGGNTLRIHTDPDDPSMTTTPGDHTPEIRVRDDRGSRGATLR